MQENVEIEQVHAPSSNPFPSLRQIVTNAGQHVLRRPRARRRRVPALSFALLLQVPRDRRDEDIDVLLLAVEPTHEADQAWAAPLEQKAVRDQPVDGRFGKLEEDLVDLDRGGEGCAREVANARCEARGKHIGAARGGEKQPVLNEYTP